MNLEKDLAEIAENVENLRPDLNEQGTIQALILPFIRALGYDVFNPSEVAPQYTADFGEQSSAKVDFALMHDDKPAILFECKRIGDSLDTATFSQLMRYFAATDARIGILTNGIAYRFFSDLDEPNKMDKRPFLVIDLTNVDERSIVELNRFTKQGFDVDGTLEAAAVLKYTRGMKQILAQQLTEADDDFVRWLVKQVYSGILNQKQMTRFTPLVGRAFREFIHDRINQTLRTAMDRDPGGEDSSIDNADNEQGGEEEDDGIVTTPTEIEGYAIVKSILRTVVDTSRIIEIDRKTFFGIYLDGKVSQLICRLHFNNEERLQLGVLDAEKNETKHVIDSPDGIFDYAEELRATMLLYISPKEDETP